MQPTWLDGLGLVEVAEGRYQHEATGIEVQTDSDRYAVVATIHAWGDSATLLVYDDMPAVVRLDEAFSFWLGPAKTRRFAAALTLAADIATAYTRSREATP